MPNELPLPPELRHLIEKREGQDRRSEERPETRDAQPPETDAEADGAADERRAGKDRRDQSP
jgi:hypothetical protein